MEKKHYDKAIRDRIPEIMEKANVSYEAEVLEPKEFELALRLKLVEEANEAREAMSSTELTKELADVLEVVRAISHCAGISLEELEDVRLERAKSRGAFERRLFLRWTSDPPAS